ncbi:MAG: SPFH domain-containing protein [Candidatus Eisenbacteria bacterium]|nr:SPFH domain-containing protein [Candidatus Eisenbacteria bacterium]
MNMFGSMRSQLRSVIEWTNPDPNALFHKWSENGDEIKNASKLIVNPGQGCVFVHRGKVEAVIEQSGTTDLKTDNIPFWTTITKFMQSFESENKVGIYFFQTKQFLNEKWGTNSTIKYEDPKYKFPVGLRAFGNYSFRIADPQGFFVNVVGVQQEYTVDEFRQVVGARLVQPLTDFLATSQYTYTQIDGNREEIAAGMKDRLTAEFQTLGFEMADFRIEGTSFDEDTMRRINLIADTSAEAQAAAAAGLNYAQMQQLAALRDAAKNEGGMAGAGVGLGAGIGFGQMMAGAMGAGQAPAQPPADPVERLAALKKMLDGGLITQADFDEQKKRILSGI